MYNTNFVQEMSWVDFQEKQAKTNLVIIPCGAVEVYGPHLPMGTDTLVALRLAQATAEKVEALIAPPVWAGQSAILESFPGTLTIKAESLKAYLQDLVDSFIRWGMTDFLFINSHLGNVPVIEQISMELIKSGKIRCAQVDTWRFVQAFGDGVLETGAAAHGHASEAGTSVMLHLYPELCKMERAVATPAKKDPHPEIIKYQPYHAYTETGTIGEAPRGTAEKGEVLFNRMTDCIVSFVKDAWNASER